jgi:hypothetical protein
MIIASAGRRTSPRNDSKKAQASDGNGMAEVRLEGELRRGCPAGEVQTLKESWDATYEDHWYHLPTAEKIGKRFFSS